MYYMYAYIYIYIANVKTWDECGMVIHPSMGILTNGESTEWIDDHLPLAWLPRGCSLDPGRRSDDFRDYPEDSHGLKVAIATTKKNIPALKT